MKTLGWGKNNLKGKMQSHIFTTNRFVTFSCKVANNRDDSKAVVGAKKVLNLL